LPVATLMIALRRIHAREQLGAYASFSDNARVGSVVVVADSKADATVARHRSRAYANPVDQAAVVSARHQCNITGLRLCELPSQMLIAN
jgi:hypothetical protein